MEKYGIKICFGIVDSDKYPTRYYASRDPFIKYETWEKVTDKNTMWNFLFFIGKKFKDEDVTNKKELNLMNKEVLIVRAIPDFTEEKLFIANGNLAGIYKNNKVDFLFEQFLLQDD